MPWRGRVGLVAILVLAAGLAAGTLGRSLRSELVISDPAPAAGVPLSFTMRVCSNSILPMTTVDARPSWTIASQDGAIVADSSHYVYTLELKNLTWGPRSCRSAVTVEWDQRSWNQPRDQPDNDVDPLLRRGGQVPPGSYRLEVRFGALAAASTNFEIVER